MAGPSDDRPADRPSNPAITQAAEAARVARQAREAEALRANLRRRKQGARAATPLDTDTAPGKDRPE